MFTLKSPSGFNMTGAQIYERSGRRGWAVAGVLIALANSVVLPRDARTQPVAFTEYTLKAALFVNIAKYTDWPADAFSKPSDPIVIGVLGEDPFGEVLDQLVRGRFVNRRAITVRRASAISELKGAHLVFVSSAGSHTAQDCAVLESSRVVTVGDTAETAPFTAFNFSIEGERIVFSVDLARTKRAGVNISSRLLQLAKTVKRTDEWVVR